MKLLAIAVLALIVPVSVAHAQSPVDESDRDPIIATARDYIDGFGNGDTTRVRRALHPDLAKRLISGESGSPSNQGPDDLVGITARMAGRTSVPAPADSILILDRYRDMAMVRIGAGSWVDYLHIARFGDKWQIINVAWQLRR